MRPTFSPSTSRTFRPMRSSMLISMLLLFLCSAARDALDDVARNPDLPIERSGLARHDIELDVLSNGLHARPRNSHRLGALRAPESSQSRRYSGEDRAQTHPRRGSSDKDVSYPRL